MSTPSTSSRPLLPDESWNTITDSACSIVSSVVIHGDGSWKIFVHNKEVPATNSLLAQFPNHIVASSNAAMQLVHAVHSSAFCPGNPDIAPYRSSVDARFKVEVAIGYCTTHA